MIISYNSQQKFSSFSNNNDARTYKYIRKIATSPSSIYTNIDISKNISKTEKSLTFKSRKCARIFYHLYSWLHALGQKL